MYIYLIYIMENLPELNNENIKDETKVDLQVDQQLDSQTESLVDSQCKSQIKSHDKTEDDLINTIADTLKIMINKVMNDNRYIIYIGLITLILILCSKNSFIIPLLIKIFIIYLVIPYLIFC